MWFFSKLKILSQILLLVQHLNLVVISRIPFLSVQDIVNQNLKPVIPQKNKIQAIMHNLDAAMTSTEVQHMAELLKNLQVEFSIRLNNSNLNTTEIPIQLNSTNNIYIYEQILKIAIYVFLLVFILYVVIPAAYYLLISIQNLIISYISATLSKFAAALGLTNYSIHKFGERFSFTGVDGNGSELDISFYVPDVNGMPGKVLQGLKITIKHIGETSHRVIYDFTAKAFTPPVNLEELIISGLRAESSIAEQYAALPPQGPHSLFGAAHLIDNVISDTAQALITGATSSQVSTINSVTEFSQTILTTSSSNSALDQLVENSRRCLEIAQRQANSPNLGIDLSTVVIPTPVLENYSYFSGLYNALFSC